MGFKDAEWAYSIDRPLAETAVLAALCLRTDDTTHETFVGQETIASMLGSSPEKVRRALGVLERDGVITRTRRHGSGGYRTSDLITVNVSTYRTNVPPGDSPTRQIAHQEIRRHLPDDSSPPTGRKVPAEEITQIDHPEDHPVVARATRGTRIPDPFDVTPEMVAWARERCPLVDGRTSTEMFVNYWTATTGRNAVKRDWPATWRNWMLRDQQTAERAPGRRKTDADRVNEILNLPDPQLELTP